MGQFLVFDPMSKTGAIPKFDIFRGGGGGGVLFFFYPVSETGKIRKSNIFRMQGVHVFDRPKLVKSQSPIFLVGGGGSLSNDLFPLVTSFAIS